MNKAAYARKYADPRIDEAYRLYVDGKASLKVAAAVTASPKRTLERRSVRDGWKGERDERQRVAANDAAVAVVMTDVAATTPPSAATEQAPDLETKILQAFASSDTQERFGAVLGQQRQFFDELMLDAQRLHRQVKADAEKQRSGKIPVGQLLVVVGMGDKIATQQRKAHGIPDLSKLEVAGDGLCRKCAEQKAAEQSVRNMTDEELKALLWDDYLRIQHVLGLSPEAQQRRSWHVASYKNGCPKPDCPECEPARRRAAEERQSITN